MIRHLPIIKPNKDVKLKIVKNVDLINKILEKNNGIFNESTYQVLKELDEIIYNLYSITINERMLIQSNITNQINHFKLIYNLKQN